MANDNTIVPFKPKAVTPEVTTRVADQYVVKAIEGLLESAKAGKIKFVAIATVDCDGSASTTWEPQQLPGAGETTSALGAVAYLNFRFGRSVDDGGEYTSEFGPKDKS